jgi:hypothetical protein
MMKAAVAVALAGIVMGTWSHAGAAQAPPISASTIRSCILAAANLHREPPALLLILLNVEGGTLGAVSQNTNGTVDIGPMQVNQIWVPTVAAHWDASTNATYEALRYNFCANVEAGAWILRQGLDEARGDLWGGVAYYHSHNPVYQQQYLLSVLKQALRLESRPRTTSGDGQSALTATDIHDDRKG